jgi:hypothetical protein
LALAERVAQGPRTEAPAEQLRLVHILPVMEGFSAVEAIPIVVLAAMAVLQQAAI